MPKALTNISGFKVRAFTLVELMITATITAIVVASVAAFTIQGLKIYYNDSDRLLTNHDMRRFTQEMATDAVSASAFYIYPDFNTRTINGNDAYIVNGQNGQSGDFLVLVTNQTNITDGTTTVTQVIGYYRVITDTKNNVGTLYRFVVSGLSIAGSTSITTILNTIMPTNKQNTNPVFLPSVIGTSQTTTPASLFYNYSGDSVIVKAQIEEQGNQNQTKSLDTYNLTIQPRG